MPAITAACQDETLARFVPVPVPYTEEHARTFVAERPARWQAEDGEMTWAITDADRRRGCWAWSACTPATPRCARSASGPRPEARGRGVMTAAARLVIRFGFEVLGWADRVVRRSSATTRRCGWPRSWASGWRAPRRAGLLHRGERRDGWVAGLLPGGAAVSALRSRTRRPRSAATACC